MPKYLKKDDITIYPEISVQDWTKKYQIKPRTVDCRHCDKKMNVDIPYLSFHYVGFIAFNCNHCQGEHKAHTGKPISKQEINAWNNLLK